MVTAQKSAKQLEDENKPPQVKVEEPKAPPAPKEDAPFTYGEKLTRLLDPIPAHWNIIPDEDDIVVATCTSDGEVFRGTVAEFNKALRAS